jgi:rhamnosyltransferase
MQSIEIKKTQIDKDDLCAVVVTHHPDERLIRLLSRLLDQVAAAIIVDNGTPDPSKSVLYRARDFLNVTLIENQANKGIAAALNQGVKKAIQCGFTWAITFDQDSEPDPEMVTLMLTALHSIEEIDRIAIVGPQVIDASLGRKARFLRRRFPYLFARAQRREELLEDVTIVITSGAMFRSDVFEELAGFREDFFMDYVDTDFCLRSILHGHEIIVATRALLYHAFGNRKKIKWGPFTFFPSFHPPGRWYTISRNRIQMMKDYALRIPHWAAYELLATGYILLRMLLTEDDRKAKISSFLLGTWHGIRGKLGEPDWANPSTGVCR